MKTDYDETDQNTNDSDVDEEKEFIKNILENIPPEKFITSNYLLVEDNALKFLDEEINETEFRQVLDQMKDIIREVNDDYETAYMSLDRWTLEISTGDRMLREGIKEWEEGLNYLYEYFTDEDEEHINKGIKKIYEGNKKLIINQHIEEHVNEQIEVMNKEDKNKNISEEVDFTLQVLDSKASDEDKEEIETIVQGLAEKASVKPVFPVISQPPVKITKEKEPVKSSLQESEGIKEKESAKRSTKELQIIHGREEIKNASVKNIEQVSTGISRPSIKITEERESVKRTTKELQITQGREEIKSTTVKNIEQVSTGISRPSVKITEEEKVVKTSPEEVKSADEREEIDDNLSVSDKVSIEERDITEEEPDIREEEFSEKASQDEPEDSTSLDSAVLEEKESVKEEEKPVRRPSGLAGRVKKAKSDETGREVHPSGADTDKKTIQDPEGLPEEQKKVTDLFLQS